MIRYFIAEETRENIPVTLEPRAATVPTMTMEIPEAINAYSMAVAPPSSRTKRRSDVESATVEGLIMALCLFVSFGDRITADRQDAE